MRRAALLLMVSGCFEATGISFEQHPEAHTTILIDRAPSGRSIAAWVFDHDSNARSEVALNVGRDDRLFLLAYRQPIAWLQLEAGLLLPDPSGARELPRPDIGAMSRASPLADNEWVDTDDVPSFGLPDYSIAKCADDGLCLADPQAEYCSTCIATASIARVEPPLAPAVTAHPPRQPCATGFAHFLGEDACAPVGASCPATGGATVALDSAALLAMIGSRTPTIALGAATYDLPILLIDAPLTLIGCNSVIRFPPDAGALVVLQATLALRSLRFEGGSTPVSVTPEGRADLQDVSFDGVGPIALHSEGRLTARRISIEGRQLGVDISSGRARIDGIAIRNVIAHGIVVAAPPGIAPAEAEISGVSIEGTPINTDARAILVSRGTLSLEGALIERGKRTAIETIGPESIMPRLSDVTIRDMDGPATGAGVGGIIGRGTSRFGLIARIWIEDVNGTGMEVTDPDVVIEDLRIDGVRGNDFFDGYGLHGVSFEGEGGASSLARVWISNVPGAPLALEAQETVPLTRWTVSDVRIESDTADRAAITINTVDVDLTRAELRGGVDGVVVLDGSRSALRDLSIEGCARDAVVLESDARTSLSVERAIISGCAGGVRSSGVADLNASPDGGELRARDVSISGASSYGILVEGALVFVEGFVVEGGSVGIGLGAGARIELDRGLVARNLVGARAVPEAELRPLVVGVRFEGNERGIEVDAQVP